MITKFFEATQYTGKPGLHNWGKFMVGRFEQEEYERRSEVDSPDSRLLSVCGWTEHHVWVMDLQTGEGAFFQPHGYAHADLQKHAIWVCPMFEPFLEWLYKQDLTDLDTLPALVELPEAEFALAGYRRPGPEHAKQ